MSNNANTVTDRDTDRITVRHDNADGTSVTVSAARAFTPRGARVALRFISRDETGETVADEGWQLSSDLLDHLAPYLSAHHLARWDEAYVSALTQVVGGAARVDPETVAALLPWLDVAAFDWGHVDRLAADTLDLIPAKPTAADHDVDHACTATAAANARALAAESRAERFDARALAAESRAERFDEALSEAYAVAARIRIAAQSLAGIGEHNAEERLSRMIEELIDVLTIISDPRVVLTRAEVAARLGEILAEVGVDVPGTADLTGADLSGWVRQVDYDLMRDTVTDLRAESDASSAARETVERQAKRFGDVIEQTSGYLRAVSAHLTPSTCNAAVQTLAALAQSLDPANPYALTVPDLPLWATL